MSWTGRRTCSGRAQLHPIFFGSFDWHSCVHGYWLLLRTRRLFPALPVAARVEALLDEMLTPAKVAARARLSRPGLYRRVRAALWLGLAARAPRRGAAPRGRLGGRAGAARQGLRRTLRDLPSQAHLSDPHRHPLQHRLRDDPGARMGGGERFLARRPHSRAGGHLVRPRPGLPGLGARRRRLPLFRADRSPGHAPHARRRPVPRLVRRVPAASRQPASRRACSPPLSSRTARTPRSPISTASTSPAPGAGAASPMRSTRASRRWRWKPPTPISTPACRTSPATIWASIGWPPSPCWRSNRKIPAVPRRRPGSSLAFVLGPGLRRGMPTGPRRRRGPVGMVYKSLPVNRRDRRFSATGPLLAACRAC